MTDEPTNSGSDAPPPGFDSRTANILVRIPFGRLMRWSSELSTGRNGAEIAAEINLEVIRALSLLGVQLLQAHLDLNSDEPPCHNHN